MLMLCGIVHIIFTKLFVDFCLKMYNFGLFNTHIWFTSGRASGNKNSAPILFMNTSVEGML